MNEYSVNIFAHLGTLSSYVKRRNLHDRIDHSTRRLRHCSTRQARSLYRRKYFSTHAFERSFDQTSGDAVFYHDGEPLFDQLLTDIQQASSSIHMMFFIVKNDKIGQRILQALKAKAEQGVSVFCSLIG
ncbi:hypothetical protein OE903_18875 [Bacillus sp. B6(2022)]|nr:hypothetical protein [Bacillus sp. B6(2022)]